MEKEATAPPIHSLAYAVRKMPEHPTDPGARARSLMQGTEVQYLVTTFHLLVAKPDPDSVSPLVKQANYMFAPFVRCFEAYSY